MKYSDTYLREILLKSKVIACVGISVNPNRPSHEVASFLTRMGYDVIPVNPVYEGQELFGHPIYPNLGAILAAIQVDLVDIFRKSEFVMPVVDEALTQLPALRTIWMQIGVFDNTAVKNAENAGVSVVYDRCPKVEYKRLISPNNPINVAI